MKISNINIHRRTFEGKTDEAKNSNPITSKYNPSKKYAVSYDLEGYGHNPSVHCVITKKDALEHIKYLKKKYTLVD
jgi:hypothetical protein